jgi:hypothetical protein
LKKKGGFSVKSNLLCLLALVQEMRVLMWKKGYQDPSVTLCFPEANNRHAPQVRNFVAAVIVLPSAALDLMTRVKQYEASFEAQQFLFQNLSVLLNPVIYLTL